MNRFLLAAALSICPSAYAVLFTVTSPDPINGSVQTPPNQSITVTAHVASPPAGALTFTASITNINCASQGGCLQYFTWTSPPATTIPAAGGDVTFTLNVGAAPAGTYDLSSALHAIDGNVGYAAGCTFVITVGNPAAPNPTSGFAHFAAGGSFTTGFTVVNNSAQSAQFSLSFYTDAGAPALLPFNGFGTVSTLSDTLPPNGTGYYETGDPKASTQGGWVAIKADPSITIQELFRNLAPSMNYYEASVPASNGTMEFRIPFDATSLSATGQPLYTGFAIANLDATNTAALTCTVRDFRGNTIPNAITIPVLNPLGHWANYLFPAIAGGRGSIDCTANRMISVIGLRFIGTDAFSSLPVIAH